MGKQITKRRSRDEWRDIIVRQEGTGKAVPEYCRQKNLNEKSFYAWRKRLRLNAPANPQEFIPVKLTRSHPEKSLRIHTPDGYRVDVPEGIDGLYVQSILKTLGVLS